ncbi:hypothetical protein LWM68_09270 [Niabella sp. W65]|nr:hypothetical protein [Niabella sp. W65]MCH7362940.1 hypothetical protein [Niabella sp. W65]ULT38885.1 hypothetical protein KRR40_27950 [Niabella sp. I65]
MNEFRDPYVFFNSEFNEYWMIVSAQQSGKGVLLVYKTTDPASNNWQLRGTLNVEGDYLMLECADIFKWGINIICFLLKTGLARQAPIIV